MRSRSYFTAPDLADIGRALDAQERLIAGKASGKNYDDTGYFSIQVIQNALAIWNLELLPRQSEEASQAREYPENEVAYICHLQQHWFTLRRFGKRRWYNLDSTQVAPSYLTDVYLGLLLQRYSVFVVRGSLSTSAADRRVLRLPIPGEAQSAQPKAFSGYGYSLKGENSVNNSNDDDDDEETLLAKAIEASLQDTRPNDMDEIRRKRLARFGG
ncbi:Ataxin-3 [Apophysomyces sp. BC1034]|nr:Ataxin-3 [Apophysomyces sp. BC1021]KAG0188186.1 Ataxin-3 [Apophysomyces sp. BC1034]